MIVIEVRPMSHVQETNSTYVDVNSADNNLPCFHYVNSSDCYNPVLIRLYERINHFKSVSCEG